MRAIRWLLFELVFPLLLVAGMQFAFVAGAALVIGWPVILGVALELDGWLIVWMHLAWVIGGSLYLKFRKSR
jgi:hypothetical protein